MLNDQQIKELFDFCKKHYIHYYEVQCELVDHFANSIEEQMAADPKLEFSTALNRSYQAFGEWRGMQRMQEEKRKQLSKAHSRLKWSIFFSYFKLPRIALTLLLIATSYSVVTLIPDPWNRMLIVIGILMTFVFEGRSMWKLHKRIKDQRDKLLLFQHSGSFSFVIISFIVLNSLLGILIEAIWPELNFSNRSPDRIAIVLPLYIIITNSYKYFMDTVYKEAVSKYPQLFKTSG